jgi:dihydroxyacid dehydratase/phosphogluconate dehydratase
MGKPLSAILASMPEGDIEIIRPLSNPISQGSSIAILRGSLAPESAVVKLGIRDGSRPESFDGRAVVYDDTAARRRDLDVPAAELAARSAPSDVFPIPAKGYLGIYRRDVQPMATGAVLTDLK